MIPFRVCLGLDLLEMGLQGSVFQWSPAKEILPPGFKSYQVNWVLALFHRCAQCFADAILFNPVWHGPHSL